MGRLDSTRIYLPHAYLSVYFKYALGYTVYYNSFIDIIVSVSLLSCLCTLLFYSV